MGGGTPVDVTPAAASPTLSSGGDSLTGAADARTQALAALDGTISRARHPSGLVPASSAQRGLTPSSATSGGDSGGGGGRRLRQASGPTTVVSSEWGANTDRAAGQADRRPRQPSRQSMVASVIGGAAPSIGGGAAVARTRLASGRSVRSGFSAVGGGPALRADPADPIYKVTSEDTPESLAKKAS